MQLQRRGRARAGCGQRVNRLAQVSRQVEPGLGFATHGEGFAHRALLIAGHAGRGIACNHFATRVNPGHRQQLGVLTHQSLGLGLELFRVNLLVGHVPSHTHQLPLAVQQAQANLLLRILHIALQGFLFALHFLQSQVAEGRHDGRQKQQHCGQRGQHRKAVLQMRRQGAPPALPGTARCGFRATTALDQMECFGFHGCCILLRNKCEVANFSNS